MKEKDSMRLIKLLLEHDQFIPLSFSEVCWFEKDEMEELFVNRKRVEDQIPGFFHVIKRMNELLRIDDFDTLIDELIDGVSTTWAFQMLLSSIKQEDYEDTLYGRLNRMKVREGWDKEAEAKQDQEIQKLLRFKEHITIYLGRQIKEELDFQKGELAKLDKKKDKPEPKGKAPIDDPSVQ